MLGFDRELSLFNTGCLAVGAVDEAGRGPLAGPVVAACVILKPGFDLSKPGFELIKDSKMISEKNREKLFPIIMAEFAEVGVGWCDHETIDRINILEATFLAMKQAIGSLKQKPDHVLVDGKFVIPNYSGQQTAIIDGDALVFSIAAASIIAKVTRDRMMLKIHEKYPQYGFDKHKGYGTKQHMEAIERFGPAPIHRMSFAPLNRMV